MKWFTLFLVWLLYAKANGQSSTVIIEKKWFPATPSNHEGSKLIPKIITGNTVVELDNIDLNKGLNFNIQPFVVMNDTIRLQLIGALLRFEDDTSMSCMFVSRYSFDGFEGLFGTPVSKRMNTQLEALFMINRLGFPYATTMYSPYTVLFDRKMGKELNDRPEEIKKVFRQYRCWYDQCMIRGGIIDYFPFNDGRFTWFAGKKGIGPKPSWYPESCSD